MIRDDQHFKELFFEQYQTLFNTAYRILGDEAAADDVTQDVFAKLWANRKNFIVEKSIDAYLKRAVINTSLNYIEKRKRNVPLNLKNHEKAENHTAQSIIASDLPGYINNAVDNLPPKCRVIFCLSRFEGLSNQEIADELKLSKRTVENQLGNALIKLRQQLKPILSGVITLVSTFT
ncbi:MAG: RNA polymerase sigma-70 factor [Cyclobacteriaceae bacterium]|nr:RNA polymerase sigma-70 factor [Cyclobacteriaceae bacterium]